jgi:hypothetical protein
MKGIFKASIIAIALLSLAAMVGCASLENAISPSPESLEELQAKYCGGGESVILKVFGDPMTEDTLFKTAGCALLQYDAYSVEQARKTLDTCKYYLSMENIVISGADVFKFVYRQVESLREVTDSSQPILILSILAPRIDVPDVLTPCDKRLLLAHIEHQMEILDLCRPASPPTQATLK